MKLIWLVLTFALVACDAASDKSSETLPEPSSLEKAAIEAGVIPDVRSVSLSGAFERKSDLGTDRFCAVGNDERGYQIGMLAVFGPDSKCEALGEAQRNGENIAISLTSEEPCNFVARFDGVELRLPGSLPEPCESYCSPRAGFAGVSFNLMGEGDAVARSTRGRDIENLCPDK